MAIFDEIKLKWAGREYTIPPDRVLKAIAQVEDHLTLAELHRASLRNDLPMAKLAEAYAALLRFAGARVSGDDVYAGMFGSGDGTTRAVEAVQSMLAIMIPPNLATAEARAPGKSKAGGKSSPKRSKPQSRGD